MKRRFALMEGGSTAACPKCGNATEFVAFGERCAEDCCELWVECGKCGFDPTAENHGHRVEDVMGEVSKNTIPSMLSVWNELVAQQEGNP